MTKALPPIYGTKPWSHQVDAYNFAFPRDHTLLAMRMGEGKSLTSILLHDNWRCRKTLVVCPKHVIAVWNREFKRHGADQVSVFLANHGTVKKRTAEADKRLLWAHNRMPVVVVTNYDSIWRPPFGEWALSKAWDLVIADESHRIKSGTSKVSKYAEKLGKRADHRLALTGTPLPHSPLDVFGQARFLYPGHFGSSWHRFRTRYAEYRNPSIPQMVTGYCNQAELEEIMGRFTFRTEGEVQDLPPTTHEVLTCELPPSARKKYTELKEELITEMRGGVVTAANALTRTIRLRQLVSGCLPIDDSDQVAIVHAEKEKLLTELLSDLSEPVVVFAEFRYDLDAIRRVAEKLQRPYGEVSGRRHDLSPDATYPDGIDVLGVQYQSGGSGVDLQNRSRIGIYYSPTYRLGDYEQSLKRLHRPGQTKPVIYYHLVCESTIDEAVRQALSQRADVVGRVLATIAGQAKLQTFAGEDLSTWLSTSA